MSIFDNDILSRLGVRVAFAPPERRREEFLKAPD